MSNEPDTVEDDIDDLLEDQRAETKRKHELALYRESKKESRWKTLRTGLLVFLAIFVILAGFTASYTYWGGGPEVRAENHRAKKAAKWEGDWRNQCVKAGGQPIGSPDEVFSSQYCVFENGARLRRDGGQS